MSLDDTSDVQSVSSIAKGFYWAGAVVSGSYIYFGGDGGYLYYRPVGSGFGTTSDTDIQSTSLNLAAATGGASDAGNVRSTVMLDGDKLYFTSQGGYLWCCSFDEDDEALSIQWKVSLDGTSTSTPTLVKTTSGTTTTVDIYTGYYFRLQRRRRPGDLLHSGSAPTDSRWPPSPPASRSSAPSCTATAMCTSTPTPAPAAASATPPAAGT